MSLASSYCATSFQRELCVEEKALEGEKRKRDWKDYKGVLWAYGDGSTQKPFPREKLAPGRHRQACVCVLVWKLEIKIILHKRTLTRMLWRSDPLFKVDYIPKRKWLMERGRGIWRQNHNLLTLNLLFSSDFLCSPLSLAPPLYAHFTLTHKNTTLPQVLCVRSVFSTKRPSARLPILDMSTAPRQRKIIRWKLSQG